MSGEVKVYALSTCPYCRRTKRFLDENGVRYAVVDVDLLPDEEQDDALAEVERLSGRQSFPVIVIGDEVVVGHDQDRLRKALGL
jgi:glutaredoxin-like protein NrdH